MTIHPTSSVTGNDAELAPPLKKGHISRFADRIVVAGGIIEFGGTTVIAAKVLYARRSHKSRHSGGTDITLEGGMVLNTEVEYSLFVRALSSALSGETVEYLDGMRMDADQVTVPGVIGRHQ